MMLSTFLDTTVGAIMLVIILSLLSLFYHCRIYHAHPYPPGPKGMPIYMLEESHKLTLTQAILSLVTFWICPLHVNGRLSRLGAIYTVRSHACILDASPVNQSYLTQYCLR